jgi:hypothetical protein
MKVRDNVGAHHRIDVDGYRTENPGPVHYWVTLRSQHLHYFKNVMNEKSFNWCFRLKP